MQVAAPARPFVQPRDPIELELALIWQSVLGGGPVSVQDNFFELGGGSLDLARVASRVRARFDEDLPLAAFFQHQTIEELAGLFRERAARDFDSQAVRLRRGDGVPVFFVHEVYGAVTYAYDLANQLGEDRAAYGFQPPGLYNDRERIGDVPALAAEYVAEARHLHPDPDGPYALAGYCTGGIVALEMAHQLTRAGARVALVALLDSIVWDRQRAGEFSDVIDVEGLLYREFVVYEEPIPFERFKELDRDGQVEYVLEGWKQIDLAPCNAGPDFVRGFLETYQVNARGIAAYKPAPYAGKVCLFLPSETLLPGQTLPPVEESVAAWRAYGVSELDVHQVPGNHFSLFSRPHVLTFGERLRACLAEAGV